MTRLIRKNRAGGRERTHETNISRRKSPDRAKTRCVNTKLDRYACLRRKGGVRLEESVDKKEMRSSTDDDDKQVRSSTDEEPVRASGELGNNDTSVRASIHGTHIDTPQELVEV